MDKKIRCLRVGVSAFMGVFVFMQVYGGMGTLPAMVSGGATVVCAFFLMLFLAGGRYGLRGEDKERDEVKREISVNKEG